MDNVHLELQVSLLAEALAAAPALVLPLLEVDSGERQGHASS